MLNLLKNLATKVDKLQEEVTLLKAANTELRGNNIGNNNNTSANFWNQLSNNTKAMNAIKSMASTENNNNIQRKEKNLIITEKKPEEDAPRTENRKNSRNRKIGGGEDFDCGWNGKA